MQVSFNKNLLVGISLLTILVTMIACSCNDNDAKPGCVAICDKSLNNCVVTLGQENKLECHKTYDLVCMPSCGKRN